MLLSPCEQVCAGRADRDFLHGNTDRIGSPQGEVIGEPQNLLPAREPGFRGSGREGQPSFKTPERTPLLQT